LFILIWQSIAAVLSAAYRVISYQISSLNRTIDLQSISVKYGI